MNGDLHTEYNNMQGTFSSPEKQKNWITKKCPLIDTNNLTPFMIKAGAAYNAIWSFSELKELSR